GRVLPAPGAAEIRNGRRGSCSQTASPASARTCHPRSSVVSDERLTAGTGRPSCPTGRTSTVVVGWFGGPTRARLYGPSHISPERRRPYIGARSVPPARG